MLAEGTMRRMRPVDVARFFGRSPDWLKMLERAGVIPRARRDFSGHRYYEPSDVDEITRIIRERAAANGHAP